MKKGKFEYKKFFLGFGVVLATFGVCGFISHLAIENDWFKESESDQPEKIQLINGKKISILGDSISTYEGWNNNTSYNSTIGNNAVWYTSSKIDSVNKTYWKRTIDDLSLELCVNNSWSGSEVTNYYDDTSAGCLTRATNLHNDNENIEPDIIVVYLGINDYYSVDGLGTYSSMDEIYNSATKEYIADTKLFAPAYATMLHKVVNRYKTADVYCMNLIPIGATKETEKLSLYNDVISSVASDLNCNLVDIFNESGINVSNISTYTIDGTHPTADGHYLLSECLKKTLLKNYLYEEE